MGEMIEFWFAKQVTELAFALGLAVVVVGVLLLLTLISYILGKIKEKRCRK